MTEQHHCEHVFPDGTVCGKEFQRRASGNRRRTLCDDCKRERHRLSCIEYRKLNPPQPQKTTPEQREYQRRYYETHKDKAREYQRNYNLRNKSSSKCRQWSRDKVKGAYNTSDILHAPTEKSIRIIEQVIRGERFLVR